MIIEIYRKIWTQNIWKSCFWSHFYNFCSALNSAMKYQNIHFVPIHKSYNLIGPSRVLCTLPTLYGCNFLATFLKTFMINFRWKENTSPWLWQQRPVSTYLSICGPTPRPLIWCSFINWSHIVQNFKISSDELYKQQWIVQFK
jgi:hypothetical protein